jgi:hypothetical protein
MNQNISKNFTQSSYSFKPKYNSLPQDHSSSSLSQNNTSPSYISKVPNLDLSETNQNSVIKFGVITFINIFGIFFIIMATIVIFYSRSMLLELEDNSSKFVDVRNKATQLSKWRFYMGISLIIIFILVVILGFIDFVYLRKITRKT